MTISRRWFLSGLAAGILALLPWRRTDNRRICIIQHRLPGGRYRAFEVKDAYVDGSLLIGEEFTVRETRGRYVAPLTAVEAWRDRWGLWCFARETQSA